MQATLPAAVTQVGEQHPPAPIPPPHANGQMHIQVPGCLQLQALQPLSTMLAQGVWNHVEQRHCVRISKSSAVCTTRICADCAGALAFSFDAVGDSCTCSCCRALTLLARVSTKAPQEPGAGAEPCLELSRAAGLAFTFSRKAHALACRLACHLNMSYVTCTHSFSAVICMHRETMCMCRWINIAITTAGGCGRCRREARKRLRDPEGMAPCLELSVSSRLI